MCSSRSSWYKNMVRWSKLSLNPGGWEQQVSKTTLWCQPVFTWGNCRQDCRQQIIGEYISIVLKNNNNSCLYSLGACQARGEDRIEICLQRVQQRILAAKRHEPGTNQEFSEQGWSVDGGSTVAGHHIRGNNDSDSALTRSHCTTSRHRFNYSFHCLTNSYDFFYHVHIFKFW